MSIKVFTDGSARPNPGYGGAGSVILVDDKLYKKLIYKGGHTTNNRMELFAVIMTFKYLPKNVTVELFTDSNYVKLGITEWSFGWIKRNWMTKDYKTKNMLPIANQDLWKRLLKLKDEYPLVSFHWVKAHNNNKWNDLADTLANKGSALSKLDEN